MAQNFTFEIKHSEETFTALSHMQYDLFCTSNQISRSAIALGCMLLGIYNSDSWWSILIIAYGCYLLTTKYLSANRTARKLSAGIKQSGLPFPSSRYEFTPSCLRVSSLPEGPDSVVSEISYSSIKKLGEDLNYVFIFPTEYGGYLIPKELIGSRLKEFKAFMLEKTGLRFTRRTTPLSRLKDNLRHRENEPYHL